MRLVLTRCPAPVRTEWGVIRCVVQADKCNYPEHLKWKRVSWPMVVVWKFKPWWSNKRKQVSNE